LIQRGLIQSPAVSHRMRTFDAELALAYPMDFRM
jgi:hypothetical protein